MEHSERVLQSNLSFNSAQSSPTFPCEFSSAVILYLPLFHLNSQLLEVGAKDAHIYIKPFYLTGGSKDTLCHVAAKEEKELKIKAGENTSTRDY